MSGRYEYQRESRFERHARTVAIVLAAVLLALSAVGLAIHTLYHTRAVTSSSLSTGSK